MGFNPLFVEAAILSGARTKVTGISGSSFNPLFVEAAILRGRIGRDCPLSACFNPLFVEAAILRGPT